MPYTEELKQDSKVIGKLDFIFAKARYSRDINGITPKINDNKEINLINARHPLIDPDKVVPISLSLGNSFFYIINNRSKHWWKNCYYKNSRTTLFYGL